MAKTAEPQMGHVTMFKKRTKFSDLHIEFLPVKQILMISAIIILSMLVLSVILYGTDTGATKLFNFIIAHFTN